MNKIRPVDVVLDIGCGIQPQNYVIPSVHICCEPFVQYVDYLQHAMASQPAQFCDRLYVVLQASWEQAVTLFPSRSVDTVFVMDVIEHLEKETGISLLRATECLARHQVIIFTPLGFVKQEHPDGKDAWGLDGGKWQEHRSGWLPEDFDESWETYATKNFHLADNMDHPYRVPVGAFFAIKTIHFPQVDTGPLTRQKAHLWLDQCIGWVERGLARVQRLVQKVRARFIHAK
ncbi:MAG: class I SAM-dependent methyltransferase [Anaerolineae bacterium]|nr:class I SAM-dependent methyltransferase [Anaerolineae bacterium]